MTTVKTKSVNKSSVNRKKYKLKLIFLLILCFGVLLGVTTYAWFSTNLNVRIETFRMGVKKNTGLTISLDGITFDNYIEVSSDILIEELKNTYPDNTSQWAENGLVPVSSPGVLSNTDSEYFDIYVSGDGVRYGKNRIQTPNGYVSASKVTNERDQRRKYNQYIAFDVFFKNESDSPMPDNLYLEPGTEIKLAEDDEDFIELTDEQKTEMRGLYNSTRIGIARIDDTPLTTWEKQQYTTIQHLSCHNRCFSVIYDPVSRYHTQKTINEVKNDPFFIDNLTDNMTYPTYAFRTGGKVYLDESVYGTKYLRELGRTPDNNMFILQNVRTEDDLGVPLFEVPSGVTKTRLYIWIEGQDIDSIATDSKGALLDVSINFSKDTAGQY